MSQEAVKNILLSEEYGFTQGEGNTLVSKEGTPVAWDGNTYKVVQTEEKEDVTADTDATNTVSEQTDRAFASEAPIDTGIVENQTPVNVGLVDNLEGVTIPDYASSATHYNSATGEYGTLTAGQTETVGTGTYIDKVLKDADGNTVFEDKTEKGEDKEVVTIKADAPPKPEL